MEDDREKLIALHAVHGEELADYTLCGYAHDVFCEKDSGELLRFAGEGEIITCVKCRETLDRIRNNYQGYRRKTKKAAS